MAWSYRVIAERSAQTAQRTSGEYSSSPETDDSHVRTLRKRHRREIRKEHPV